VDGNTGAFFADDAGRRSGSSDQRERSERR
jgi:hypothetical protein